MPVSGVRLQQLEHAGVVGPLLPRERVGHEARQVVVAEGHRVRVTQRPLTDLGRRPRTDAGHGADPTIGLVGTEVDDRLES